MSRVNEIRELLVKAKYKDIITVTKASLEEGVKASDILNDGLLAGMDGIAQKWAAGKAFIPEVLMGARCMNAALDILEPHLVSAETKSNGTVVFGTVKGDQHDIGKNLCILMLKAKSFDVVDVGVDADASKFVEAVKEHNPVAVCMSSLLTTSMQNFKVVIDALSEAGLRDSVKVGVGGAPVTPEFAKEVGADFFTEDAVSLAEEMMKYAK